MAARESRWWRRAGLYSDPGPARRSVGDSAAMMQETQLYSVYRDCFQQGYSTDYSDYCWQEQQAGQSWHQPADTTDSLSELSTDSGVAGDREEESGEQHSYTAPCSPGLVTSTQASSIYLIGCLPSSPWQGGVLQKALMGSTYGRPSVEI